METKALEVKKTRELDKIGKETLVALLTHRTKTAAAKALSIDDSTLYQRINKYELNKLIEEIPTQALQQLQLGSARAAEVMVEALERPKDRMDAAKEVLDRTGVGKGIAPNVQVNIANIIQKQKENYGI